MYFLLSIVSFIASVVLMWQANVDRAVMLLMASALFAIASSGTILSSEVKAIRELIKDKILAEKTMAALYKATKERAEEDDRK